MYTNYEEAQKSYEVLGVRKGDKTAMVMVDRDTHLQALAWMIAHIEEENNAHAYRIIRRVNMTGEFIRTYSEHWADGEQITEHEFMQIAKGLKS